MRKAFCVLALVCLAAFGSKAFAVTPEELKDEIKLGRSVASIIAGCYGIYDNPELVKYVNLVGRVQARYNGSPDMNFCFAILNSNSIYACSCPGGYIFITKGLLFSLKNEAELSAVLAHEIAHVNYQHVYNSVAQKKSYSADSMIAKMIGGKNVSFSVALNQFVNKTMEILFKKGLPQENEYEADTAALFYLRNTGYSVVAYRDLLSRLLAIREHDVYSGTHPPLQDRINNLDKSILESDINTGEKLEERFITYVKTN